MAGDKSYEGRLVEGEEFLGRERWRVPESAEGKRKRPQARD